MPNAGLAFSIITEGDEGAAHEGLRELAQIAWDLREGKLPNPDVEYPDLGEPAAFACSNRICSFPSFTAEELQANVKQMAKLKPVRATMD